MARKNQHTMSDGAFEIIARRFRVLSDPTRLKILHNLGTEELSVGELVERTGGSQPSVSKHLSTLLSNGLVTRRRDGTSAYYAVADPSILKLCDQVCQGIERDLQKRQRVFR